jgi:hypothetical protein
MLNWSTDILVSNVKVPMPQETRTASATTIT